MVQVKRENWKGTYQWVARSDKNKIITRRRLKGSKLSKQRAIDLFSSNGTFHANRYKKVEKMKNVTEVSTMKETSLNLRYKKPYSSQPKYKVTQYVIEAEYKGKTVAGRSQRVGKDTLSRTAKEAKERAWTNFINRLSEAAGFGYDEDEGIKLIDRVKNLREGWVYYR